jgi:type II secretory pathway component HofQ
VIKADKVEVKPKVGAAAATSGAAERATRIVIPRMEFQEVTLSDALDFLRQQAVKHAEGKEQAVNIVLLPDAKRDAKVTLNLRNVPLSDALRYLAQLTGNELAWTAEAAVIGKPGTPAAKPRHDDVPSTEAARKAAKIVIPSIEFVEAPLSSVIEFLVKKSLELDPEKKGVNIILQLSDAKPPAITLNLRNVPLLQALKYVAQLSGLEIVADERVLQLQQKTGNKQP